MGFRQEHGKVLKLQVVQSLFGYLPFDERAEHEESFEAACRQVMGKSWDDSGLSMESAEGLSHYLRGVASVSGNPMRINNRKLMSGLTRDVLSLESRISACDNGTLAGAMTLPGLEQEAGALLKRYGLDGLSTEGLAFDALKFVGKTLVSLFLKKGVDKVVDKAEKAFDAKNVDHTEVRKMVDYISTTTGVVRKVEYAPVEGKVSGEGIVKNLTWGHEFDEKDPVGFLKKKFAEWEKFYHAHEAAVSKMSDAIRADEKSTRAAIKAVDVEDNDKMEEILNKASDALLRMETPTKVAEKMKPVFPGARMTSIYKPRAHEYGCIHVIADKAAKDVAQIRTLKKEEAVALLEWLHGAVSNLQKYTTVFEKARWSDHSDGDVFWDQIEQTHQADSYAGLIYWQSCDDDFLYGLDDISEILARLNNGIMNWIDRSFHDHRAE